MFSGNFYGIVIGLLTLVAALVITSREISDKGVRFEITIEPISQPKPDPARRVDVGIPKPALSGGEPGSVHMRQPGGGMAPLKRRSASNSLPP